MARLGLSGNADKAKKLQSGHRVIHPLSLSLIKNIPQIPRPVNATIIALFNLHYSVSSSRFGGGEETP